MLDIKKTLLALSISSVSFYATSVIGGELGCVEKNVIQCKSGHEAKIYVTKGKPPQVAHEKDLDDKINNKYPEWYRGSAPNGMADEDSHH
uniref:Uncharacterized protein n=1 Tax=Candidatus Kentrum sp. LPFa TaxID=2126335 RepID=A0A450VY29_9GAMM|nr:MAG: hypothetical protein BECKLPF1236A_GA0070988_1002617 [Candidatus Kentron sp. LPFa]VFK33353.1 MAG: hypothetical protein BECKLPF1236C_GA0070990_102027 [Candidatus Kentron sp. LPFa]